MWKINIILSLVLLFSAVLEALAQDNSTDYLELYSMAKEEVYLSKGLFLKDVPIEESPVPSSVYERKFIERFGFKNLRNFLDYLPSFYLTSGYGERTISFRGFRSITSSSVLFLEDGIRITSPDYESLPFDWAYPFHDLERIEIMYGSGGSIFGAGSFSGVINLERRYYPKEREVSITLGELGDNSAFFKLAQGPISLSGYRVERGSERLEGAKSYEVDSARFLSGKLYLGPSELSLLLAEEETLIDRKMNGTPGIYPEVKSLIGNKLQTKFYSLSFKKEAYLRDWKLTIKPSFSLFEVHIPFYSTVPVLPAFKNSLKPQRWELLAHLSGRFKEWDLIFGSQFQLRKFKSYHTTFFYYIALPSGRLIDLPYSYPQDEDLLYAFFISASKSFGLASLHLGTRYEHYEGYPGRVIPRVGFSYKLTPNLTFLLSYTEGVNIPSFFHKEDREIRGPGNFTYSFMKLSLEKEKTLSASLIYSLSENLYFRNTIFSQIQSNRIWYHPKVRKEINLPPFKVHGLESELKLKLTEHLAFLNLTYLKPEEEKSIPFIYEGKYIAGIPNFMLKGGISLKIKNLAETYLSPSFKVIGNTKGKDGESIPGYGVLDLYLLSKLNPSTTIGLRVENLFDKHFKRAGGSSIGVPWDGRRISVDLNLNF